MKTRTIYRAFLETYRRALLSNSDFRIRQWRTFERELLRRMDERDAMFYGPDGRKYRTPRPPAPKPQIITRW